MLIFGQRKWEEKMNLRVCETNRRMRAVFRSGTHYSDQYDTLGSISNMPSSVLFDVYNYSYGNERVEIMFN